MTAARDRHPAAPRVPASPEVRSHADRMAERAADVMDDEAVALANSGRTRGRPTGVGDRVSSVMSLVMLTGIIWFAVGSLLGVIG